MVENVFRDLKNKIKQTNKRKLETNQAWQWRRPAMHNTREAKTGGS